MSCRAGLAALLAVVLLAPLAIPARAANPKGRKMDLITISPDFASYGVKSVAILPVVTYDENLSCETKVAALVGRSVVNSGYRWVSAQTAREMLRSTVGDSVLKLVKAEIRKSGRVDSLRAPLLCSKLRTDAVLSVRVELWDQQPVLWNQSGKPATSVQMSAAIVDSSGALLWSASGSQTGEGPYHDPSTNPIAVSSSNLDNTPVTGQGGPPSFDDVLGVLLLRWQAQFPAFAAPADSAK